MLHVLNGDATAEPMRGAGIPGVLTVWADLLHEGPVRYAPGSSESRRERAEYLSRAGYADVTDVASSLRDWDAALERWTEHDEVVLWLEHDLFDQLLLIRHLTWFAGRGAPPGRLSLICIGEFPGVDDFHGLGELSGDQLATLYPLRQPVSARQFNVAQRAWTAFISAEPGALAELVREDEPELPFLMPALRRLLGEYPATFNGLSVSEQRALEALASAGELDLASLMRALHRHERFFYMPDGSVAQMMRGLGTGDNALAIVHGDCARKQRHERRG
jgi:hypothetical protein